MVDKMLKHLEFDLPVEIFKEKNHFVARTPVLDFAVQGKTKQEVKGRFTRGVVLFFEELADLGTTNEVLTGLGWKKVDSQWQPAEPFVESISVKIPVSSFA